MDDMTLLIRDWADRILDACRDRFGRASTRLLADGIEAATGSPCMWKGRVLSNFARQQDLLRVLDALETLNAGRGYREQALKWSAEALRLLQDPRCRMLYWGGHSCYDLAGGQPLVGNHELKSVYPYWRLLWDADHSATREVIEGVWNKHVGDWATLLFNRHGEYNWWRYKAPWEKDYPGGPAPWAHVYQGGSLPIVPKDHCGASFITTGTDLIVAAAMLSHLSGHPEPGVWARRLVQRYDDMRDPRTGLAGHQFSFREPCGIRQSLRPPWHDRLEVNAATVITRCTVDTRYGFGAIALLALYEEIGAANASPYRDLAVRDLLALAKHSYDPDAGVFRCMLLNGEPLTADDVVPNAGHLLPAELDPVPANGMMLLSYARAFRLTGDARLGEMVQRLAGDMGWGNAFARKDGDRVFDRVPRISPVLVNLSPDGPVANFYDVCALQGCVEFYRATRDPRHLAVAEAVGKRLLRAYCADGWFHAAPVGTPGNIILAGDSLPLALLHLAAARDNRSSEMPIFYASTNYFDPKVIERKESSNA